MSKTRSEFTIIFLLTFIHFIHLVDFVVIMPLGPSLMKTLQITPAIFASMVSAYNFAGAITGLVISLFADKFEKKTLLSSALVGVSFGTIFCGLANTGQQLIFARAATGFFGGVLNPLVFALVAEWIPPKRRGKAMAWVMSGFSLASVIGVPLGLVVNDYFGHRATFYFIGVFIFLSSIACFFGLPKASIPSKEMKLKQLLKVLGSSFSNKKYLQVFIYTFFISGTMFLLIPMLAPFAVKNMGMLTTDLKFMYLIGGVLTVITARLFGVLTDKFGGRHVYAGICALSVIPIYFYTHSGVVSFPLYIAIGAVFMSLISGRMIPAMTLTSNVPEAHQRGQFIGILNSVRALATALGSLVVGLVVVENSSGKLIHFDQVGRIAIIVSLISIIFTYLIFPKDEASS
jgi:MFS transporter, DHA1 family, inner membrane transport protein